MVYLDVFGASENLGADKEKTIKGYPRKKGHVRCVEKNKSMWPPTLMFALIVNLGLPQYTSSFPVSPLAFHNFMNLTSSNVELQDFNLTSHFIDLAQQIICKTEFWQVCALIKMFPNTF